MPGRSSNVLLLFLSTATLLPTTGSSYRAWRCHYHGHDSRFIWVSGQVTCDFESLPFLGGGHCIYSPQKMESRADFLVLAPPGSSQVDFPSALLCWIRFLHEKVGLADPTCQAPVPTSADEKVWDGDFMIYKYILFALEDRFMALQWHFNGILIALQ